MRFCSPVGIAFIDDATEREDKTENKHSDDEGKAAYTTGTFVVIINPNSYPYQVVCLIEGGKTTRQALEHMMSLDPAFKPSLRWAQNIHAGFKRHGVKGLIDGRTHNKNGKVVLTPEVKQRILAWWYARPGAHAKNIWRKVVEECRAEDLPLPSYDAVRKFLVARPEHEKLVRAGKIKVWDKQARPVVRYNITSYSNERWQVDHNRADIYVRERVGDGWAARQVWLTVFLDAHSRCITGFQLSTKSPDAWTSAALLRHAVLPKEDPAWFNKGLPNVVQPDRGKDFLSNALAATSAYLGIIIDPDPPYYPNRKGKIERFFRTIDSGCFRMLPGHMSDRAFGNDTTAQKHTHLLLTRSQLIKEIERFIVHDYHQREHSETKRKPIEHWRETVRLRMPESTDALDNCLLKSDVVRKVRNTGIDFHLNVRGARGTHGGRYWCPELVQYWAREVRIRYNPEDLQSIRIYCASTGEYLCEPWLMGHEDSKYGITDIKRSRSQFRKGLIERQKDYAREIHEQDRRMARADWNDARTLADEMASTPPEPEEVDMDDVAALLARFEREDRDGA